MLQSNTTPNQSRSNPLLWSLILTFFSQTMIYGLAFAQKSTEAAQGDMEVIFVSSDQHFFVVNRGKFHGLALGDLICAIVGYETNSKETNEECGPIISLKPYAAGISVHAKQIQRIKVEHAAISYAIPKPKKSPTLVSIGYHYSEKSPFSYKLTKFNLNAFADAAEPVWLEEAERSSGFSAPFLALGTLRPSLWSTGIFRLKLFRPISPTDSVDMDYSLTNPNLHAKTTVMTSGTVLESTLSHEDFVRWQHISTGPLGGLQGGQYQLNHQVQMIDDQDGSLTRLVAYEARWWSASLTFGWLGRWTWGAFHTEASWTGTYPIWLSAPTQSIKINLPPELPTSGSDEAAYKKLVHLKKGTFGQHLSLGIGGQF